LENPQDELTKKYQQAMNELNEVKNRIPILELVICEVGLATPEKGPLKFDVTGSWPPRDLDAELEAYKRQRKLHPITNNPGIHTIRGLFQNHNEVERYNRELANHLKEYSEWLKHCSFVDQVDSHRIEFALWLDNTGTSPADDVDMTLELGDSVVFLFEVDSEDADTFIRSDPPDPPEPPKYDVFSDFHRLEFTPIMPEFERPNIDLSHLWGKHTTIVKAEEGRPHRIEFSAKRLKHFEPAHVGNFVAVLRPDDIRPFQIKFRITAATMPKPVEGEIPVIVRQIPIGNSLGS
jgi:hypothetical protein